MIKYELANINLNMNLHTLSMPLSVYLKITDACMLDCIFCSQKCFSKSTMDINLVKKILYELKQEGIQYVYYTGGEPLLHPQITEILKLGKGLGFKQILVTNAILFNNDAYIKNLDYIDCLGISLHGPQSKHDFLSNKAGTYKNVTNAIKQIRKYKFDIPIDINCTLVNENTNEKDMSFLARYCKKYQLNLSFARLNYINKAKSFNIAKENIEKALNIISSLKEKGYRVKISNCIAPCIVSEKFKYLLHGCSAGFGIAAIESNGDVKICPTSEYILGNVIKKSFKKIWHSKELKLFRNLKWLPPQCTSCTSVLTCKGGCRAEIKGLFWKETSDQLVYNKFEDIWNKIKDKTYYFLPEFVRKDYKKYTIVHFPARLCSEEVIDIIKKINLGWTPNNILKHYKFASEIKNLFVAMSRDNLLIERNEYEECAVIRR